MEIRSSVEVAFGGSEGFSSEFSEKLFIGQDISDKIE
jgi:hypothetical protein